jgi:prepilin-type processing-associated H-X9-DG protein
MRTDSNRLLVGGTPLDDAAPPRAADPFARRHLAEIIIGLLIVAACLYIFVPVFMGTAESARRTICVTHLRRLAQAVEMYQGDHDGLYPPATTWVRGLHSYVIRHEGEQEEGVTRRPVQAGGLKGGLEVFDCPSEVANPLPRRRNLPVGATLSSYTYNPPLPGYTNLPFAWDLNGGTGEGAHPKGGNVAYLDGRVHWRPASQWASGDRP